MQSEEIKTEEFEEVEVNKSIVEEDELDNEDLNHIDLTKFRAIGRKFIERAKLAVQDSIGFGELTEVTGQIFQQVAILANSITSKVSQHGLKEVGAAIYEKAQEFIKDEQMESAGDESVKNHHHDIFNKIYETACHELSVIEGSSDHGHLKLTDQAAQGVLNLLESLISKATPKFSFDLIKILGSLIHYLGFSDKQRYLKQTRVIYDMIKKFVDYNDDAFGDLLINNFNKHSRFSLLAYLYDDKKDQKIFDSIVQKFNDLVMNDKEKSNHINIIYFTPFLRSLDFDTFKASIFSEIEFMLKRNGILIPIIAETISNLDKVKINSDQIVQTFTSHILQEDFLTKEDYSKDMSDYFRQLARKVDNTDSAKSLIIDYLLKRFSNLKTSSIPVNEKQNVIKHIYAAIDSAPQAFASQDIIQAILPVLIDHLFNQKDEAILREVYDDILKIFLKSQSYQQINEPLKKLISRTTNVWQINLFQDLMDDNRPELNETIAIAALQFKNMLAGENFKNVSNYSQILALTGFFVSAQKYTQDKSHTQWLIQNDSIMTYFNTIKGFANTQGYFQRLPSHHDVKNHMKIIQFLITHHYTEGHIPYGDQQLRDTLYEYLINQNYKFRQHIIYDCLQGICKKDIIDQIALNLLKSLFNKIKDISSRPVVYLREEYNYKQSISTIFRVKNAVEFIIQSKESEFSEEEFFTLIKIVCHPYVTKSNKDLLLLKKSIGDAINKVDSQRFSSYFEKYAKKLVDFSIRQRSGILSSNENLRKMAINIAVLIGSQGHFNTFVADLVDILQYKPLETAQKLENLFVQEFDRISFYDLMLYSEITKDLLNVFDTKDAEIAAQELGSQQEGSDQKTDEEESKADSSPVQNIDPAKLAAQMLKAQAAQKKTAGAAKKGSKTSAKPTAAKDTTKKPQASKKEEPASQHLDKEKRNKEDREQIVKYLQDIQQLKAKHIETVQEIVKRVNSNNLYLDLTLNHLLMPMIKLLNFAASKFSTVLCFQHLFKCHKNEPLFHVKNELVSCLIAISHNRIQQKHMREFQQIFSHINNNTSIQLFDKGYISLLLMMANYVLKDLSVHLSVKEEALNVVQSLLDTNNLVENIDLVLITINMMKSSYNNQNLGLYLNILLRRLNLEQLALILQRIFEYEPVPRMILLKELLEYETPLCCPVWFSSQLWILQFDEECGKVARKLWNKYGMVVRTGVISLAREHEDRNVFHFLRSNNTNIFDASVRAMISAIEIFQNRFDLIIDDLIQFYDQEVQIIEQLDLKSHQMIQEQSYNEYHFRHHESHQLHGDNRLNRIAVPDILKKSAYLVQADSFKKIFEFFITKGCLDQNETIAKASMDAALQIISIKGQDYSEEMLKILEKFINESKKYSELSRNQAIIMIGYLAGYLDSTSQKKLVGTFEKMLELLNTPSEMIRLSICKVIPLLAKYFEDKSKKFLEDHLHILRTSSEEKLFRGSAYAVAGIVKGLGLQYFNSLDLYTSLQKECFTKHSDPLRKIAGLYIYETLSLSLGKVFEMQIEKTLPNVMLCISDPKENVRKAAINANRTIMGRLSNHAIKQVLPIFLNGLAVDNWRSKLAAVEALGNMAFCAPRQISSFLPRIVKGIREVLNDTHEKVHEAALQAIQNIGSVIKCPEIADILETLVRALANPNQYLKDSLKVLLDTSFVHAIDAPSLSLLIPILDSGLMMHDNQSKQLASKLMGNICNLTQDPEDLLPYIKILMPAIKNSLFDSIPEIRASAAKALGSLSKGLGLQNSYDMLTWLNEVLHQKNLTASERSGAAQGYAEIISVHGETYFEKVIETIVSKSQDNQSHLRESFRSVLVFLATSLDRFVQHLPKLLPIMIQGLSDDVEEVRKISMRNVKICIRQFGKQSPHQLVVPIMEMMFHKDFRVRSSSSVLMYQLVKELENDVIKSQPKYITIEMKQEILSSMFILRYDSIERVSLQASQIWKNIIDNQLKVLREIVAVVIKQVFSIIQHDQLELQEMGLNCLRGICEKFGEKIVNETLDIFENYLERATQLSQNIGISKAIYNMAVASPTKLLTDLRIRFLGIMDSNISHESEEIRDLTAKVFITTFQKTYEPIYMTSTLDKQFLKKLHHLIALGSTKESDLLIQTLKTLLKQGPELKLEDKLVRLCNPEGEVHNTKFSIAQAKILSAVASKISSNMFKKKIYNNVLNALMQELIEDDLQNDDENRINEVLLTFSELISTAPENEIVGYNENVIDVFQRKCEQRNRLPFYVDFIGYYCSHTQVNYERFAQGYLRNVLKHMNHANDKLVDKVIKAFNSIINGFQKENQFVMIPLIRDTIETIGVEHVQVGQRTLYSKKVPTIKMLEKPDGAKYLSTVIQNSITHGQIEVRIDSAILFQYLIDFSKLEAIKGEFIKICGALIRVVNDKFPPTLKLQIFLALKLILLKANAFVKAMAPQLQTTFLKAFNDSSATPLVRKVVVDCLVSFMKIAPKVDPIVKELVTMLEGDKLEQEQKIEISEILAIIIRTHGKVIQSAQFIQISNILTSIVETKKRQFNDKSVVNSAVALACLAAYAKEEEGHPKPLELFNSFDNTLDINITLGLKFGLLLNGNPNVKKEKYIPELESYIKEILSDLSGVEEMDGRQAEEGKDNGRLHGAFEILGHIGDVFIRRFSQPQDDLFALQYRVLTETGFLKKLNQKKECSQQTFKQVLFYLSSIPVKTLPDGTMNQDLQQVIAEGFTFINNYYLEFDHKRDAVPSILNLLMLNYNNFLDIEDDKKIKPLTVQGAKDVVNQDIYKNLLSENIRSLAVELLFI